MQFSCQGVTVAFKNAGGRLEALADVSFECRSGEFLAIIGPSGCGKTTLLRIAAGILAPDAGAIEFSPGGNGSQRLLVYQEDSLFPWMTVLENAAFGLEVQGAGRAEREEAARAQLTLYGLGGREGAYPHQISAGMKQRVAVIRAFLSNPALLLLDEPFGALDSPTRAALQEDLLDLWRRSAKTVVFVTHDVDEAIYLSDRVLVMTGAPGQVKAEVAIDLPREDRRGAMLSERFLALKRQVLQLLGGAAGSRAGAETCHAA